MRTTFSTLAILATSLLVKDVLAGPIHRVRDVHVEISEEITLEQGPDGKMVTKGVVYKTSTVGAGQPPAQPTVAPAAPAASPAAKEAYQAPPAKPSTTAAAPQPPASSAPASNPPSSGSGTSSGGKRGLAYNKASLLADFPTGGKFSWAYNWAAAAGGSIPSGIEFVPMCWGPKTFGDWRASADKALSSGATHFLGFNEPDFPAPQADMDVGTAQSKWTELMSNPYHGKVKLGSPAVTSNAAKGKGLDWLTSFLSGDGIASTVDFVVIHWYSGASQSVDDALTAFKQHCSDAKAVAKGKPIWITEFQYIGQGDQSSFVSQVVKWLDQPDQSYIERYAYQMVGQEAGQMIDSTNANKLSAVGSAFAS